MTTSLLAAYIDCSDMRLGDRMASAWLAQHRRRRTGERFGVLDRCERLQEPFSLPLYFPDTFESVSANDPQLKRLPPWNQGNLWLSATNAFARSPEAGAFEHLPEDVRWDAERLRRIHPSRGPRVLMHVLDDAPYNRRRNWQRRDAEALSKRLKREGCQVTVLNPRRGEYLGGYPHMLAQMLATDLFIGGDTGPSHVFAMLCPQKPQIAIYPDMRDDQAAFATEQRAMGLALPWSSLPLRSSIQVFELRRGAPMLIHRGGLRFDVRRCSRFDVDSVALAVRDALISGHRSTDVPPFEMASHAS